MAISTLLKDIQDAMLGSLEDGKGKKGWSIREDRIVVTTRASRDPSRSRNGGEYNYYRIYELVEGGVGAFDDWSCEIGPRSAYGGTEEFYPIALSSLERIGLFAESRAIAIWNKQAIPACPVCGESLEEILSKIGQDERLREIVICFLKRQASFGELRDAVGVS